MDELDADDIHGADPATIFRYDDGKKILVYEFSDLTPTSENNNIINYSKRKDDFDFAVIIKNCSDYFNASDNLASTNISELNLKEISFANAYDAHGFNFITVILIVVVVIGLMVVIGVVFAIVKIVKSIRKKA